MELRLAALQAFLKCNIDEKVAATLQLPALAPLPAMLQGGSGGVPSPSRWHVDVAAAWDSRAQPGRPDRPLLRLPTDMPRRKVGQLAGHAAMIHAICHIEFNAINLALDAMWRFSGMPELYYWQWARVAVEEARHFSMLRRHLNQLPRLPDPSGDAAGAPTGLDYGDFPAHDGLWDMCVRTQEDIVARMALVPRTLEARGLDATPLIQGKLRHVATPWAREAVGLLDVLLHDEIGHVAIGNHWYRWLCDQQQVDPAQHYIVLSARHNAPVLKPPFNWEARSKAGFTEHEMAALTAALA